MQIESDTLKITQKEMMQKAPFLSVMRWLLSSASHFAVTHSHGSLPREAVASAFFLNRKAKPKTHF